MKQTKKLKKKNQKTKQSRPDYSCITGWLIYNIFFYYTLFNPYETIFNINILWIIYSIIYFFYFTKFVI